jgi:molecular chaperone GrpE
MINNILIYQFHNCYLFEDKPNFEFCRVVDREIRDDIEEQTITKIVRQGFQLDNQTLRPIEVITSKKSGASQF